MRWRCAGRRTGRAPGSRSRASTTCPSTASYGGMWWRCGGAPQYLVGNGFIAQGFDFSSYYRRNPDSFDPRAAFVFAGVGAGRAHRRLRADRWGRRRHRARHSFDRSYGTPPHALNLASSEKHTDSYLHVNEDVGHMHLPIGGQDDPRGARGHRVLRNAERRGSLFHRIDWLVLRPLPPGATTTTSPASPATCWTASWTRRPSTTAAEREPVRRRARPEFPG